MKHSWDIINEVLYNESMDKSKLYVYFRDGLSISVITGNNIERLDGRYMIIGSAMIPLHRIRLLEYEGNKYRYKDGEDVEYNVNEVSKLFALGLLGITNADTNPVKRFTEITPEGNEVKGFRYVARDKLCGSLVITRVNGVRVLHIVRGFPKFKYLDNYIVKNVYGIDLVEKTDGTNILFYPLKNHNGDIIEVVAKTRFLAVADKKWTQHFPDYQVSRIEELVKDTGMSVAIEMYGMGNEHDTINYTIQDRRLTLEVIGIIKGFKYVPYSQAKQLCELYELTILPKMFNIMEGELLPTEEFYTLYGKYIDLSKYEHLLRYKTYNDIYSNLRDMFAVINENAWHIHDPEHKSTVDKFRVLEGIVWHVYVNDDVLMIKNKDPDIEADHRSVFGIRRGEIAKSYHKATENLPILAKRRELLEFMYEELKEDYSDKMIEKSKSKINMLLDTMLNRRDADKFESIARHIYNKHYGISVKDMMREFAKEYPELRKRSATIFLLLKDMGPIE